MKSIATLNAGTRRMPTLAGTDETCTIRMTGDATSVTGEALEYVPIAMRAGTARMWGWVCLRLPVVMTPCKTATRQLPGVQVDDWRCERSAAARQGPSVQARMLAGCPLSLEIDNLAPAYGDLLITTGSRDTQVPRSAPMAARIAIVPVRFQHANLDSQYPLVAQLNSARMFNPLLRVVFVVVADDTQPSSEELAAVRLYVSHVMSATLATTVIHDPCTHEYGRGRCACDAETCDPDAASELAALYREIYLH